MRGKRLLRAFIVSISVISTLKVLADLSRKDPADVERPGYFSNNLITSDFKMGKWLIIIPQIISSETESYP